MMQLNDRQFAIFINKHLPNLDIYRIEKEGSDLLDQAAQVEKKFRSLLILKEYEMTVKNWKEMTTEELEKNIEKMEKLKKENAKKMEKLKKKLEKEKEKYEKEVEKLKNQVKSIIASNKMELESLKKSLKKK